MFGFAVAGLACSGLSESEAGSVRGKDKLAPVVTSFSAPSSSASLQIPILSFTASDNVGVTGFLINETATKPLANASGWRPSAPTSYAVTSSGSKVLYAWAKDASGKVSEGKSAAVTITLPPATGGTPGLLQPGHFVYKGAFRVPKGKYGNTALSASLSFGGMAMTFRAPNGTNGPNGSIYIAGRDGLVMELGIPAIVNGRDSTVCPTHAISCLNTASVLQGSFDLTQGNMTRTGSGGTFVADVGQVDGPTPVSQRAETRPSGLLVHGDRLIGSVITSYDPSIWLTHYSSNLTWDTAIPSSAGFKGFFRLGVHPINPTASNAGLVGGYMTPVPPEWREALGGPALTGWVVESVISRSSFGPTASVFDPLLLGKTDPSPATLLVGYPYGGTGTSTTLGDYSNDGPNLMFNKNSRVRGVVFPEGSRSVVFFGATGLGMTGQGDTCYGQGTPHLSEVASQDAVTAWIIANGSNYACGTSTIKLTAEGRAENPCCFDPVRSTVKGPHGFPYIYRAWFYDANDLVAVRSGAKKPWDLRPYATWDLNSYSIVPNVSYTMNSGANDLPFSVEDAVLLGAAYDPATRRVYLSQRSGDKPGLEPYPLIHVFEIEM